MITFTKLLRWSEWKVHHAGKSGHWFNVISLAEKYGLPEIADTISVFPFSGKCDLMHNLFSAALDSFLYSDLVSYSYVARGMKLIFYFICTL